MPTITGRVHVSHHSCHRGERENHTQHREGGGKVRPKQNFHQKDSPLLRDDSQVYITMRRNVGGGKLPRPLRQGEGEDLNEVSHTNY